MTAIREVAFPTLPIPVNFSEAHKAAIAQYYELSSAERSKLIDDLGLKKVYDRQSETNYSNGFSQNSFREYGIMTGVMGALVGLGTGVLTLLALNNKTEWSWMKKGLVGVGAGIAGTVAGLFVTSNALSPMRAVELGDAMNSSFERGNEEFLKLLASRMIERQQTISIAESPALSCQDTAAKYSTPPAVSYVAEEERIKDTSAQLLL